MAEEKKDDRPQQLTSIHQPVYENEVRRRLGNEAMIAAGGQLPAVDTRKWSKADRERLAALAVRDEPRG